MENAKKFIIKNQDRLVLTFYTGASIAAFNCLTRPDFNLFVYLYCIYIWTILEDRVNLNNISKIIFFRNF